MPFRPFASGALLLGAMVLTLNACSSDTVSPADGANLLTTAQADQLGQDVAEDIGDLSDVSVFNLSTGINVDAVSRAVGASIQPPACVTASPLPPTNSDADLVPDSLRLVYDCGFVRGNGQIIDSLLGTIDFLDPKPTTPSIGVKHIFTDFTRTRINKAFPARSFTAVHNGIREWGGSADTLGHTVTNFVTVYTHLASGRQATHEKNWVGKFSATTPGSIALGTPLPAGSWTVNGTSTWTTLNRSWSVVVSTPEALQYDPSCNVTPRFTNGTITLVVTRNGEITNVEIVFINCGQYQVTRSVPTV